MSEYKEYVVRVHKHYTFTQTEWLVDGKRHRDNGPAVEYVDVDGNKKLGWYQNDEPHRLDGPAIEHSSGYKAWYVNGKLHREDGPAIEWVSGAKSWYQNNKQHRLDGPAHIYAEKDKLQGFADEWWINGVKMSKKEFERRVNRIRAPYNGKVVEIEGQKYRLVAER